jgi:citrate synthase
MSSEYLSAKEAARMLGVSVQTLYVYVSRKGIRSKPIAGSRKRRYWKLDVERVLRGESRTPKSMPVATDSEITLISESGLFYRGQNAADLAEHATLETTAALLWGFPEEDVFGSVPPKVPAPFLRMQRLLAGESDINRATTFLPLFEEVNLKAYDLSPLGVARTGADVLRTIAALAAGFDKPTAEPIHKLIAHHIGANPLQTELIRRQLVLAADHGFQPGAVAVRTLASSGVTLWRSVTAGLSETLGGRAKLSRWGAIRRLLAEIIMSATPTRPIMECIRAGEPVPGFQAPLYANGDPRARSLLEFCATELARDPAFQRLTEALQFAKSVRNLDPNFALASLFVDTKTGLTPGRTLFHVGRSAGWIAHAIEQLRAGEPQRVLGVYKGELPR